MIFICRFDYYITPGYYFLTGAQVLRCVFPSLNYHKLVTQSFDTDTSEYLPCIKIFAYIELKKLKYVLPSLIFVSAAAKQLKAGCCFNATEIFSIQTGEQSAMLWE